MQYMLLIYSDPKTDPDPKSPAFQEYMGAYNAFTADIQEAGQMKAGDALQEVATAKTVRVRGGKTTVTDGPFAETKEILGGYYLVEAKDEAEALKIAAKIPTAKHGSIEVRPVVVWD